MQITKTIIKWLSVIHIVFWVVLMIWVIADYGQITAQEEEPLGQYMAQGIAKVIAFITLLGAVSAGMLSRSLFHFLRPARKQLSVVNLIICLINVLLLYLSVYFVFFAGSDAGLPILLAWIASMLVCIVFQFIDR